MDIRLIAFDLDGTAILDHKYLSEGNRAALQAAGERGVHLLPASRSEEHTSELQSQR